MVGVSSIKGIVSALQQTNLETELRNLILTSLEEKVLEMDEVVRKIVTSAEESGSVN